MRASTESLTSAPAHLRPARPLVVSESGPSEQARFGLVVYGLCALAAGSVIALFVSVRWVLAAGEEGPKWSHVAVDVVCDENVLWVLFLVVAGLAAYQRLWLLRHVPPPAQTQPPGQAQAPSAQHSTRPRSHAATALRAVPYALSFWLLVLSTWLSMAWFPCVCAPPFYRMALHGTVAAFVVYAGLALLAALGVGLGHSPAMLGCTLALMVAAAYASCALAAVASVDVVLGAVGMAVFYWAVILSCARRGGRGHAPRGCGRARAGGRLSLGPPCPPPRLSSVIHLVPADAYTLALGLVVADAFLFNAAVWALAHARRALRLGGPHVRAHARAAALAEARAQEADASLRAQAEAQAGGRLSQQVEARLAAEAAARAAERARRQERHLLLAEALDLEVYWPRLDLAHLHQAGFAQLAPADAAPEPREPSSWPLEKPHAQLDALEAAAGVGGVGAGAPSKPSRRQRMLGWVPGRPRSQPASPAARGPAAEWRVQLLTRSKSLAQH